MKKIAFLLLSLTLSSHAFSDAFDIVRVGVDLTQQTFFIGVVQSGTASPCAVKNEFKWSLSAPGIKEIETIAISAKAMGKKVIIGVDPASCVVGQITGMFVYIE